jgi:hypothetical protein
MRGNGSPTPFSRGWPLLIKNLRKAIRLSRLRGVRHGSEQESTLPEQHT